MRSDDQHSQTDSGQCVATSVSSPTSVARGISWRFNGHVEIHTSDGATTHLTPGDVVLARDYDGLNKQAELAEGQNPLRFIVGSGRPVMP